MHGHFKRFSVGLVLLMAIVALSNVHQAHAQTPPPPPYTPWCQDQQVACNSSCAKLSQTASVDFKCLDEGISTTTSTRSVQCVCLDASGQILSSSTLGGAGAATVSAGGSSSSSAASASGTVRSGR
jgi:hypothetical protein